jgi:hypothetical protein
MGLKDLGIFAAVLAAWFVLNRWVLPWFGVPTCMSGGCGAGSCGPTDYRPAAEQVEDELKTVSASADGGATTQPGPDDVDGRQVEVAN